MTQDYIAYVRLNAELRAGLEAITADRPGNQSDHIRQAIREYIARTLPALAHPAAVDSAAADSAVDGEIRLRGVGQ